MTEQKVDQRSEAPVRENPKFLWRSGELVEWDKATVHISQLGWTAISAVFEGIRAYWNQDQRELYVFHLEAHLKRLFQSMKIMRMTSPFSKETLVREIIGLLRANEYQCDAYIQPLAYFGEGIPGYLPVLERPGEIVITARPSSSNLGESKVVHCNVSSWSRISDNVMPPRAKAITNYQNSRYVSTESRINGYDFGIILNQQGKVSEASYACVFVVRDGVAVTPPISAGILESITREVVKTLLERELGVPVVERDLERTELYIADEVFICGTAVEVQAVGSVDRYTVGDGETGPVVARLRELFHKAVLGNEPNYVDWRTPVYQGG
ncbi:MAG: branched-chain amino acid transaminase [Chloroflexi bacterium]|nr:branched-chain amino acid transaminase [Chloroflexota bacterium]